jgi:hypothetical protein
VEPLAEEVIKKLEKQPPDHVPVLGKRLEKSEKQFSRFRGTLFVEEFSIKSETGLIHTSSLSLLPPKWASMEYLSLEEYMAHAISQCNASLIPGTIDIRPSVHFRVHLSKPLSIACENLASCGTPLRIASVERVAWSIFKRLLQH